MEKGKKKKNKLYYVRKNLRNQSIKKSLLFSMIGLTMTVSIFIGIINAVILYNDTVKNMNTRLKENATAYSQAVDNAIKNYKIRIESIAQNTSITDPAKSDEEKNKAMEKLAIDYGFVSLTTANANGKAINGSNMSDREYFKQAISGNTYISSTVMSDVLKIPVLVIATKINNGQYNGTISAALDANTFSEMIDGVSVGVSGYGFILDKNGKMIAHKNRDRVSGEVNYIEMAKTDPSYTSVAEQNKDMVAGKSGITTVTFDGKNMVTAYTPIPDTDGWSIAIVADKSELMSSFYTSIEVTIGSVIFFILISIIISFQIARPIVNPIISLVKRIEMLEEGDLHSEVPQVKTKNELHTLSISFTNTVNTLNNYIHEISYILTNLERGDCTLSSRQVYKGDFIQIKDALDKIIINLNSVFLKIRESSEQVAEGAEQISSSSQALATGTTQQAATVEELSGAISNVAVQAEQNAANVKEATEYINQVSSSLDYGNTYMQKLEASMKEIQFASEKISKITKVIEDIAFQTNILALNAAVESARAGTAGKGFAVVADEVRNLAAKSAEAAKQTADLIEYSVTTVSEGGKLTGETSVILKDVAEKSEVVNQIIQKIMIASNEQALSIGQINQGLSQVSSVVQTNAATAEESSASSEELDAQAQILKQEIEKFKLQ